MKICMVTDTYHPSFDGIVRYFDYLIPELLKKGHEVTVVCPNAKGFKKRSSPMDGLTIVRCLTTPFKANAYHFAIPDFSLLREIFKADFVFLHSLMPLGLAGGKLAKLFRKKVGLFCHHDERVILNDIAKLKPFLVKFLYRRIRRFYAKKVDIFFHATERFKRKLLFFNVNPDRIVHTPFAIDERPAVDQSVVDLKARYNLPDNAIIATYLGRLSVEKNVDTIIAALDEAMAVCPNLYALIVGDGPDKNKFLTQKRTHSKRFVFTGFIPDYELLSHYQASDMFVTPTLNESSCFTVFEAMSCKVPVITSAKDHDPDIHHKRNALLIDDVLDPQEIKENILELALNKQLRTMISNGGFELINSRTWENHAERFLLGLEELVDLYDADESETTLSNKRFLKRFRRATN